MKKFERFIVPLFLIIVIAWGAPIVFKRGGNTVPEEMKQKIVECKKPDGGDYFTFILGSARGEIGVFGSTFFFEDPVTGDEKRIKTKKFIGVYVCRELGTDEPFTSTGPKG